LRWWLLRLIPEAGFLLCRQDRRVYLLRMRRILWLLLLLAADSVGHACSCMAPVPVCSAFWQSPFVFRGRVIEIKVEAPLATSSSFLPSRLQVRFHVDETFRGATHEEVTVSTSAQSSACGFAFVQGAEYVVFTDEDKASGEMSTTKCSRTHTYRADQDEDVAWMHALRNAPAGATIFGTLRMPAGAPLSQTHVELLGAQTRHLVVDEKGAYSAAGLPPGDYEVSASVPPGFATDDARSVAVVDKGCAEVDWRVSYSGVINGRLTDAAGTPIPDMVMQLEQRYPDSATGYSMLNITETDAQGRYSFARLAPGDYIVAANSLGPSSKRPYPRMFFPHAANEQTADPVHLGASATKDHIDIVLPKAWKPVVVHAKVVLQDGTPAANVPVVGSDQSMFWSPEPAMAVTDALGEANLTVYEGRSYYLTAVTTTAPQRCAGPLAFTATGDMTLQAITIEHNWGNCLAQLNPKFAPPK
jgi:hypothetical protein